MTYLVMFIIYRRMLQDNLLQQPQLQPPSYLCHNRWINSVSSPMST